MEGMKGIPLPDPGTYASGAKWEFSAKAMAVNNEGVVVGCFGSTTPGGHAFVWSAKDGFLDIHLPGDGETCATAINDKGVVAGSANYWGRTAFVWKSGGKMEFLPIYNGETFVNGINEAGDVVGSVITGASKAQVAFIWNDRDGTRLLPSTTGGPFSRALDVNDLGLVVGFDSRALTAGVLGATPVLWQPSTGARSNLAGPLNNECAWEPENGVQGNCAAAAVAINNSGEVAGTIGGRAFRWDTRSGLTALQLPDGRQSTAAAINAFGDIAGTAMTPDLKNRTAFVWKRTGEIIELGSLPGRKSSDATGINDLGQVVGYSQ